MSNEFISKYGKNTFDFLTKNMREEFNRNVLDATYKAQKIYGFDMTKKENAYSNTHNNAADAFKHTFICQQLYPC